MLRISIIIPTYNYADKINEAIDSIKNQWQHVDTNEILVIDDGSTDNTRQVLEPFIQAGTIQYIYQPNKGKAAATQKGIDLATGDIIFNLDADDYFLPGKILKSLEIFRQYPEVVHVASPAKIAYEDGRDAEVEKIPSGWLDRPLDGRHLLKEFFESKLLFGGGSTFAARASVLKSMQWNDAVDMYTDEWLLIETLLKGDSYIISEPLSVWRVHGNNYSGAATADKKMAKQQRLEKSSAAILGLLEAGHYPGWLKKQYRLKHEVRKIVWKEENNDKKAGDILVFFRKGILSGNSLQVLIKYHAFQRLLPASLLRLLKTKSVR